MKNRTDYKSRFRILKGGKISLVASAIIVGASLTTPAFAATVDNTTVTTMQTFVGESEDFTVTNSGIINISSANDETGIKDDALYNAHTITNEGNITVVSTGGFAAAINILNSKSSIINNNYIHTQTDGGLSGGITLNNNKTGSEIQNNQNATILSKSNSGTSKGIVIGLDYSDGVIANSGTITTQSTSGKAIGIDDSPTSNSPTGDITNSGTIEATSSSEAAIGIRTNDNNRYGDITNSGTIEATSTSSTGYGIYIEKNSYANITNSGEINATSSNDTATGIKIKGRMKEDANITNSGTINIDGFTAKGIVVGQMYNNSTITNEGNITVKAGDSGGASGIEITGLFIKDSATIVNSGEINATINGELSKDAYSIKTGWMFSSDKNITNEESGKLYGNLKIARSATNALVNSGLISLPVDASASIGNFRNKSTGTLQIGLKTTDGTLVNTTNSSLSIDSKKATFEDGSTIDINILSSSTNVEDLIGKTIDNVVEVNTASGGSAEIVGILNVTDNSDEVDFEAFIDADGNLDLNVTSGNDAPTASAYTYPTQVTDDITFDWNSTTTTNPQDSDGTITTASIKNQASKGVASISGNIVTFSPYAKKSGSDEFNLTISDNSAGTVDVTITINDIDTSAMAVSLSYNNTLNESSANDGSISGSVVITLSGETFTSDANSSSNISASNVPTGLTANFVRDSDTQITLTLTGTATTHTSSENISNLTVTFTDDAFENLTASDVTNSTKSDLTLDFYDAIITGLTADIWQMFSIPRGVTVDTSTLSSQIATSTSVWAYSDSSWSENPTATAQEGLWIKPNSTTLELTGSSTTSYDYFDKSTQMAGWKCDESLDANEWHFVSVQHEMSWSDFTRDNITPDNGCVYSVIFNYDHSNDSWNSTDSISANSAIWLQHICTTTPSCNTGGE